MSRTCHDLLILPSYVFQTIVNIFHYTMTINVFSNHSPHVFSQIHVIPLSFLFINQCFSSVGEIAMGSSKGWMSFKNNYSISSTMGGPNLGTLAILFLLLGWLGLQCYVTLFLMLFVGLGNKKVTRMVGCCGGCGHLCRNLLCIVINMSPRWTHCKEEL